MVLISVQSVETDNGYQFANDFAESVIINPKSKVSLINFQFERKSDFVVLDAGNTFEVRVGDPLNELDTIGITSGTYTATSLAFAIQEALNNAYGIHHNFEVFYNQKNNTFNLTDRYKAPSLPLSDVINYAFATPQVSAVNVIGFDTNFKLVEFGANTGASPARTGVVNGTSQFTISNELMETKKAPNFANGGSIYETTLVTTQSTPRTPTGEIASHGVVIGLTNALSGGIAPASSNTPISTMNYDWLECGMVFTTLPSEAKTVKFIEAGVDLGVAPRFEMLNGDSYRIILATDGIDNADAGYPIYQYKRSGAGKFTNFNISTAPQRLSWRAWNTLELAPVLGVDFTEGANAKPSMGQKLTVSGSSPASVEKITAGNTDLRLLNHKLDVMAKDNFTRSVTAQIGYSTVEEGYVTQNIPAGDYSEMSFSINPETATQDNGDFYISVIDTNQRTLNQLDLGNEDSRMGTADPPYGNFVNNDNSTKLSVPTQNPAMIVYRFTPWKDIGTTGEIGVAKNKIYRRHDMNQYNTKGFGPLKVRWDYVADMEADTTKFYYLKTYGSSNKVELWFDNLKRLDIQLLPVQDRTGVKTITQGNIIAGQPFTAGQNGLIFTLGDNGAIIQANTDAQGLISSTPTVLNSGSGFIVGAGQSYAIKEVSLATGDPVGSGGAVGAITALTNTPAMGYGTVFDKTKSYQGYCYWLGFGNEDAFSEANPRSSINKLALRVEDDKKHQLYFELHPRLESSFGDMLGFAKAEYTISDNADMITSDINPLPTAGVTADPNPTLIVNIDNLPIKSYIGKRMKADSLITDLPVGNQQGLTKMIGKVPRHHDDNGDGGKTNTGPFYYDYFPYSVPLNNATELVLNELEISVRNPDGTLAIDVIETNMLLNITNVESVGEGGFGGVIGNPIEAPNNYDRLNVPKGQLQPEIRGGFAQSMGSMNEQPARHERSDKGNDLEPMAHL